MPKYIILEIQKSQDGTVAIAPVITRDTFFEAQSAFHSCLASAAVSSVAVHTVVLLNDVGQTIGMESFNHVDGVAE